MRLLAIAAVVVGCATPRETAMLARSAQVAALGTIAVGANACWHGCQGDVALSTIAIAAAAAITYDQLIQDARQECELAGIDVVLNRRGPGCVWPEWEPWPRLSGAGP